jgi:hypothetical protein
MRKSREKMCLIFGCRINTFIEIEQEKIRQTRRASKWK